MREHTSERPAGDTASPSLLAGLLSGWDRFWFRRGDPTTLGLIRLCCGLLTLYVHLSYSWGLLGYISPEGWLDDEVANYSRTQQPVFAPPLDWSERWSEIGHGSWYWSVFYHIKSPQWIITAHVFFLVVMLLFTLGLWTRWTGILTWIGAISYVQRASITVFGLDTMMVILLTYLMIAPAGDALSLDRLIRRWRDRRKGLATPPVEPSYSAHFATRLIQVHMAIIYLAGGTSKLLGTTWWSATSLNVVLLNNNFAPLDTKPYFNLMTFLANHRVLWELVVSGGVVFTLCVEIGFPFLVWDRRWRWVCVCGSVLLHTGIGLFMGLTTFSLMMMIMVLAFVPPEVVKEWLAWLRRQGDVLLHSRSTAPGRAGKSEPLVLTRT
jgi:hypothetical protein